MVTDLAPFLELQQAESNQFSPNPIHELVLIRAQLVKNGLRTVLAVHSQLNVLLSVFDMDNDSAQRTTDLVS